MNLIINFFHFIPPLWLCAISAISVNFNHAKLDIEEKTKLKLDIEEKIIYLSWFSYKCSRSTKDGSSEPFCLSC